MLKATLRRHIGDTPLWELLRLARRPFAYGWLPVRHAYHAYQRRKEVPTTQDAVRLEQETNHYKSSDNVHDLPEIFHYWSNKYLLPKLLSFGFQNPTEFFCLYMQRLCRSFHNDTCRFVSMGSGNCDLEIALAQRLHESGVSNFRLEYLDVNRQTLRRGKALAKQRGLRQCVRFVHVDLDRWRPKGTYHMVMANHSLHHVTDLEVLFDKVYAALHPDGYFVADHMIGRNNHMRWPEALAIVNRLWAELAERYKYNHQLALM